MHRLPSVPFERPLPVPDNLEEEGLSQDDSSLTHLKLGTAWLCATLAGVAALAYASIAQTPAFTTMLALAGLLVAYAGYGYFLPKKNTVQFADSLYYMSFLWALFILIATFLLWPAPKLSTEAVVTAFGNALVTTFCGMLLRLVVIQFQDTLPDRLVHAQERMDRRVAALVRELNEATVEITAFRDRAATDLGGTLSDLVQSLADVRAKIAEQHRTMAHMMSEAFESSLRDILRRLSAIHIPQELLTTEVGKLVAALEKQGANLDKAAGNLEQRLMQAADTVAAFGESLSKSEAAKQVGVAMNDLSGRIKERTAQFVEMTTALEKSRTELDGQLNSLQSLRATVVAVETQLAAFEIELRDVASASMSAEVRNGLMNVQKAIRSSLDASKAIESTMRDVMFFMKERVTEGQSGGRS
jgi:predicted  nucleic acid-binding Zn-ribbon protein